MSPSEQPMIPSAIVEGVGSEVVVCVGILLAGLILVAAWLSTYVPQDMRPIAVFVFENFPRARSSAPANAADANSDADTSAQIAAVEAAPSVTQQMTDAEASASAVAAEPQEQLEQPEERQADQQFEQSDQSAVAAPGSRAHLAAFDVDVLDSDGDLDPEIRERVEDVLHEYNEVMEAKSDSELRNRRLKYFNCLLNASPESSESPVASSDVAGSQQDQQAEAAGACAQADSSDSQIGMAPLPEAAASAAEVTVDAEGRPPGSLLLRLKYFNDDLRTVFASPSESIANFKQRHFQPELSRNMNIRLIYNGRELKEGSDRTLASYSIPEEATIHCLVTERTEDPAAAEESSGQPDGQGDIGNYMFPLFGGILGLIWYCRICYKAYFNFMSTMALGAVTLLFFAAFFASWSSRPPRQSGPIHVHRINLDGGDSRQARAS